MINSISPESQSEQTAGTAANSKADGLPLSRFSIMLNEVLLQPAWRRKADREMEYVDGNQLDAVILQRQQAIGMPPAIENLIGPAIESVLGYEAKTRTDWRLTADSDSDGDDVAAALQYKLNQAERYSGADRACGDAFKPQLCVGLGWVEVARESDPFKYPYRCKQVHRNEIFWDFLAKEPDLSDARYLIRRRWTDVDQAAAKFPDKADLIRIAGGNGQWTDRIGLTVDGGTSTDLNQTAVNERGWSIEEQEWRDSSNNRVCLFEVWYRQWETATVLKTPDGRVVEYNPKLASHVIAVAQGYVKPQKATLARMYCSYWMGPHKLHDGPTPYRHTHFPYVPFWGRREDRTAVPYGVVRGMVYLQDNVNATISKIRWGLSSVRTIRTKGAYSGTDAQLRQQVSRVDADIVLNQEHMAKQGAKFEIQRDFQLNEQQYKMLADARAGIVRSSGITPSFEGQQGSATSGVQEDAQIEQTTQALADQMQKFRYARTMVGELLVSLLIEDMIGAQQEVKIPGNGAVADRTITLNQPSDDGYGNKYLTNDVERIRLKVALSDVPSTASFRKQQLSAMSEAFKSMPQEIQVAVLPHLLSLMDVPNRDQVIKAVQDAQQTQTPQQIQQQIDQALKNAQYDLKNRELDAKYSPQMMAAQLRKIQAEITAINADAGKKFMELMFAGVQTAEVVTAVPQVSPVADVLIAKAGGVPGGQPVPEVGAAGSQLVQPVTNKRTGVGFTPGAAGEVPGTGQPGGAAPGNTHPNMPANPASPFVGANHGMTTMRPDSTP
jgi:hypothetical protein